MPEPKSIVFSILIPTWNNLPFLKLCVRSIQQHSCFPHQIILHINDGSDGTLTWAQQQQLPFTYTNENVGVCTALNAAAQLVSTDYVVYMNDDMYVLPGWDQALMRDIAQAPDIFFLSSTMIEPKPTGNDCVIVANYGTHPDDFREAELLQQLSLLNHTDWCGSTWPPNVVPKKLWDAVGGYSEIFSPGMSSDDDFSMKLWQEGCRYFKGVGDSLVYHFMTKSTGRIIKNDGRRQFFQKWGIKQSTFHRYYLRRGLVWNGALQAPNRDLGFWFNRFTGWLRYR
ncbi:MAG: glycosyltransferase [Chitinophagales bacterium]